MIVTCSCISIFGQSVFAQNSKNAEKEQSIPPSEQEFREATDLIAPWRSGDCHLNSDFNEPNCYEFKGGWRNFHILSLYNADCSLWYRFSVQFGEPNYFLAEKKEGFFPFSTDAGTINPKYYPQNYPRGRGARTPYAVILRLVGESEDWYKVEVHEETRETKFVMKSDKLWTKTTWSYWLFKGYNVDIDTNVTGVYDKPDGEMIGGGFLSSGERKFLVEKVEGDWLFGSPHGKLYIPVPGTEEIKGGWIRWRKGRDILVGSIFTGRKIPEIKSNEN